VSPLTTLTKNSDVKKARKQLRSAGKSASKTVTPRRGHRPGRHRARRRRDP
jgi:hypothetical protein